MEYVKTGRSQSDYTDIINDLVQKARENPTWKREYMDAMMDAVRQQREMREAEEKGLKAGMEQGERNARLEAARRMLKDNVPIDVLAKYTDLPLMEVKKLQKELSK